MGDLVHRIIKRTHPNIEQLENIISRINVIHSKNYRMAYGIYKNRLDKDVLVFKVIAKGLGSVIYLERVLDEKVPVETQETEFIERILFNLTANALEQSSTAKAYINSITKEEEHGDNS